MISTRTPARRGGLNSLEIGLLGCGTLALIFIVCCAIAIYYGRRNIRSGMSTDPAQLREWLQAEVKCDPPKGYECVRGFQATALGSPVGNILVAPIGTTVAEDAEPPLTKTTFDLTKAPMADQSRRQELPDRSVTDTKDIILMVSEKKVKAVRREVTRGQAKLIEYQVPLRKSLLFLAVGPATTFDLKSMEDFLATMRLDQPFDLPTAVTEVNDAKK